MKGYIYKIISPSGRIYIGQTINLKQRLSRYKGKHCKTQTKLYRSIEKYGWESHIFEVIEECFVELLEEREIFWIKEYNSFIFGLNCNEGGIGIKNIGHTDEAKKKMSEAAKGRVVSDETKKKMSESHKGITFSEETKKKISESNKGKIISDETKQKLSAAQTNKKYTMEAKNKMSESAKKRKRSKVSEETKLKISESHKNKKVSEKTKLKMKKAALERHKKYRKKKGIKNK